MSSGHHRHLSKYSRITHICQLQGQCIQYSRHMTFSFWFYLTGHGFKILSYIYFRIQYLYTEWLCWDKLQTQLKPANWGSNTDNTKLKKSYLLWKSSKTENVRKIWLSLGLSSQDWKWPTRDHMAQEVYQEFQLSYDIFRGWCQGLIRPQILCTPANTAQLLTLHQHRANNQYRTANQI